MGERERERCLNSMYIYEREKFEIGNIKIWQYIDDTAETIVERKSTLKLRRTSVKLIFDLS